MKKKLTPGTVALILFLSGLTAVSLGKLAMMVVRQFGG